MENHLPTTVKKTDAKKQYVNYKKITTKIALYADKNSVRGIKTNNYTVPSQHQNGAENPMRNKT